MALLALASEAGLNPKRISSSKGGEWHCPCPSCGGCDRFALWPGTGRYWCRQCKRHGDEIQFCRDFLGMSFQNAQMLIHGSSVSAGDIYFQKNVKLDSSAIYKPTSTWTGKAEEFVESCHRQLLIDQEASTAIAARGLTLDAVRMHRIGWNPVTEFCFHSDWGLDGDTLRSRLCLPKGLVIPTYDVLGSGSLSKIKIRRADWKEGDKWPKYHEIPGSSKAPALYGFRVSQIVMLVEAELDALLVLQETGGFCACVALGGATKRPDAITAEWLKKRRLILYSLDFDDAGDREYSYWKSSFLQLGKWRSDSHKSPADSFLLGNVNLREWFLAGVEFWEAAKND